MAELFLATHEDAVGGGLLVLKRILPHYSSELEFVKMFLNEARIAAQLAHPNIIQIFDLGQESGHFYLAMEFVDGRDLETIAKKAGGTIPPLLAARVGAWIADALHYANKSLNVIHRDVTPGNVMVGWNGTVKLVDFGIAKATDQLEKTRPGVVKGKFRFMSPEQIAQLELDGRTDIFSLGVLLYEITTNQKPFERKQILQTLQAVQSYDPPPPHELMPGYPEQLSRIIMRALEKDRDRRYRNGREMHRDLEEFLRSVQPVGPGEIAAYLRRVFPDARPRATVPFVPPPNPRPLDDDEPETSQVPAAQARRMRAEARRRSTRNQRAIESSRASMEQATSQMTAAELSREMELLSRSPIAPPDAPLPVIDDDDDDWDMRTGLVGADELAELHESAGSRSLPPPVATPPSRPSAAAAAAAAFADDEDEPTEATAPDRPLAPRRRRTTSGRAVRPAPARPALADASLEMSVTEPTATDHDRPRPSRISKRAAAPARGGSAKLIVIAFALAALGVVGWALRDAF